MRATEDVPSSHRAWMGLIRSSTKSAAPLVLLSLNRHESIETLMGALVRAPGSRSCLGGIIKKTKKVYFQLDRFPPRLPADRQLYWHGTGTGSQGPLNERCN